MGNGNGPVKVFGLSIREFFILAGAAIGITIFIIKTSSEVTRWQTHLEDRIDQIEKHIEYNDQRLNNFRGKINLVDKKLHIHNNNYQEDDPR